MGGFFKRIARITMEDEAGRMMKNKMLRKSGFPTS